MVRYGAKALPEGGWHTIPRVYADGVLIAGDAGGFVNSMRLKGIHLAMRTGMLAAETAFDAVRAERHVGGARCKRYEAPIDASDVRRELYPVRNVHQSFGYGLLAGPGVFGPVAGHRRLVGHGSDAGARRLRADAEARGLLPRRPPGSGRRRCNPAKIDRQLTFDRLTNVHYSGTRHAEDQPSHLIVHDTDICRTRCREEYGNPVHAVLSGERLRDGRRRRRHEAAADQRVELRPLQDLRHHGSRTRSSTGCRRKAAAGRSTRACSGRAGCP